MTLCTALICISVTVSVIGDEILKGHVHDTNSHFLCKRLFSLGVKVTKVRSMWVQLSLYRYLGYLATSKGLVD